MEPIKYPPIGQFRNLVKDVQYTFQEKLPVLEFTGTVKVHGSNASVVINADGTQTPQSRNNILTIDDDNYGFARWHDGKRDDFDLFAASIFQDCAGGNCEAIAIYGEWAGKGIQSGVAVSEMGKFFYVFGVKMIYSDGSSKWAKDYPGLDNRGDIIDARKIWLKKIDIDFSIPSSSQNALVEITEQVEKVCPLGKAFDIIGIGEGVVWEHITAGGERFSFKVKGEKHSATKVKKLAAVDVEKQESIEAFIAYAVTDNRLKQGFSEICNNNADRKQLGAFIKWVSSDVRKEESDTLESSGLAMKDIGGPLSKRAKNWFFSQEAL